MRRKEFTEMMQEEQSGQIGVLCSFWTAELGKNEDVDLLVDLTIWLIFLTLSI